MRAKVRVWIVGDLGGYVSMGGCEGVMVEILG